MNPRNSHLRQIAPEVFYSDGGFLAVDAKVVDMLKSHARQSQRSRCRLCFHAGPESGQQEMLIVMNRKSYVRPHRHLDKVETLGVIEGVASAITFDVMGGVSGILPMSPVSEGGCFFYRMPPGVFHTLIFRSEWLVFVETTIGPFNAERTEAAAWAPPETDAAAGHSFLSRVEIAAG